MTLPASLYFNGARYDRASQPTPNPTPATHRVMGDFEVWGKIRDAAPAPAMWFFMDEVIEITEQWQYYLRAINYNMLAGHVAALMDNTRAFCNKTGLGGSEPRRDYINRENLTANQNPYFSKSYACTGARVRLIGNTVDALDMTQPPVLKAGKVYPRHISEVTPDLYEYMPETHPHYFYAAVIVGTSGNLSPFPNGALYPWYKLGATPVSWIPVVRRTPLTYPPARGFATNSARLAAL